MNYNQRLELMVKRVDILTRLMVHQARQWDAPWFEGKYYGAIRNHDGVVFAECSA